MIVKPSHFRKTVTTAGTREVLTTAQRHVSAVSIQAEADNSGAMYVGGDNVSSTNCLMVLSPGATVELDAVKLGLGDAKIDLSSLWLDSAVSGDGVFCGYLEETMS